MRVVSEHPVELQNPPRVFLPVKEAEKLWGFVRAVPGEINGLGLVERRGNDLWIEEVFILQQSANAAHAEIDGAAFNRYIVECDDPSKIRFQWHSHGKIGVFFSPEDRRTISKWTGEYLISLVVNKAGKYECRLDIFEPIYLCLAVSLYVVVPIEEETLNFCKDEVARKVRENWLSSKVQGLLPRRDGEYPANDRRALALPFSAFALVGGEEADDG
ncbi:MAG: hypothetical protein WAP23_00245 [Candidatus Spechtbacterales bacterium]